MIKKENISLKLYNTFGIDVIAHQFIELEEITEIQSFINKEKDFFILGGGSNILLTKNIEKPILKIETKGKKVLKNSDNDFAYIQVEAGENWHEFVLWCIENGFGGVENLSLIPGNVGTAPMQNIGAYGVELKDVFHSLQALHIPTNQIESFSKTDCNFGYRESFFKNEGKNQYIILNVTFKLTKQNHHIKTDYGAIKDELSRKGIANPSIKDVSEAVISIRQSKLPDPKDIGNSGSFFKNPVVSIAHLQKLQSKYEVIPHYILSENEVKIPAGWLIEQCGFKGKRFGNTGVHEKQALVLINYGKATGIEVLDLAKLIQTQVKENFEIDLEMEVNII
ncbi:UDP-N-acetylmuramate dehydrogenase [Namhaeicola litoreus]|uniref:UDP-N-acetylenolpyruvoylglucosamine reductase n=1 Tax=Namhaeicola litoreus TaxID=1052145 RepID=A0ABW3Y4V6_9FLAO